MHLYKVIKHLLVICFFCGQIGASENSCTVSVTLDMDGDGTEEAFHSFTYTPMAILGVLAEFPYPRGGSLIYDMSFKRICPGGDNFSRTESSFTETCHNRTSVDLEIAALPAFAESLTHYLTVDVGEGEIRESASFSWNDEYGLWNYGFIRVRTDEIQKDHGISNVHHIKDAAPAAGFGLGVEVGGVSINLDHAVYCNVTDRDAFPWFGDRWHQCEMCASGHP